MDIARFSEQGIEKSIQYSLTHYSIFVETLIIQKLYTIYALGNLEILIFQEE